ncbi:hypothetical protein [Terrimonas pollutisoli]|uniref:hypothetical protein n=1 Tax=Terrimonas pollutisoli TaxID=3034147 RepID=UPI0023EC1413|nr:hypothetical protein [Terrimonas sp. H1YJ31]
MNEHSYTKTGTVGGTITILLANINSGDVIKTAVLAGVGAVVSFVLSLLLKELVKWWRRP